MQQGDPRHLPDFEPGLGDLIQFVRIRIVLPGYFQVDLADQQVEVVQDRRRSDILPVAYQFLPGLLIFYRFDFLQPFDPVEPENRLLERDRHRKRTVTGKGILAALAQAVQIALDRKGSSRPRDVLGDR